MDIIKIFCQIEIILTLLKSIIVDAVVDPVNVYMCGDDDERHASTLLNRITFMNKV